MRDLRAPLVCLVAALALSGCMGRTSPLAGDPALDSMAYGQPSFAGPAAYAEPAPTREAYIGLGSLYEEHPEFRARYEALGPGMTDYLRAAMTAFAERELS